MKTTYSNLHCAYAPEMEFFRGNLVKCFEKPDRAISILKEVRQLGEVITMPACPLSEQAGYQTQVDPDPALLGLIRQVHKLEYIDFVRTIFPAWQREMPAQAYALPHTFNRLRSDLAEPATPLENGARSQSTYYRQVAPLLQTETA